jgi:hypothetical protein
VGASNLFKIAQSLGVDVSFFFQGLIEEPERPNGAAPGMAD